MVTGLSAWLGRRYHSHLALGLTGGMLVLGVAGLTAFLAPAYARPPIYEEAGAPEPAYQLDRVYLEHGEPLARLLGYDLEQGAVEPGGTARVILYWEAVSETDVNYVLFAQLPGQIILDEVPIPVTSDAVAPSRLRLDVGLYEQGAGRLPVVDGAKDPVDTATIGWLKLASTEEPPPPTISTDYRLGDAIGLTGYDLRRESGDLFLTLHWSSLASVGRDYTVFVHLLNSDGNVVAQADSPPVGGDYPTSLWAPGETIVGQRALDVEGLSSGVYELALGMYLLETGDRLPATDADGERLTHDVIPLTEVHLP
jgi:hypothetical protein